MRDAFQQTRRALAPVHSYADLTSTLKATGGAVMGSTPRAVDLTEGSASLSKTGLLIHSTPRRSRTTPEKSPRLVMTRVSSLPALVPKLPPLAESMKNVTAAIKAEEGEESPRDIEALLA